MELKHTPGPWNNGLHDGQVLDNGNQSVCNCYSAFRTPSEIRANAKLVSASPELLEDSVKNLAFLEWVASKAREFNMWSDKVQELDERISHTKASIKKATE